MPRVISSGVLTLAVYIHSFPKSPVPCVVSAIFSSLITQCAQAHAIRASGPPLDSLAGLSLIIRQAEARIHRHTGVSEYSERLSRKVKRNRRIEKNRKESRRIERNRHKARESNKKSKRISKNSVSREKKRILEKSNRASKNQFPKRKNNNFSEATWRCLEVAWKLLGSAWKCLEVLGSCLEMLGSAWKCLEVAWKYLKVAVL